MDPILGPEKVTQIYIYNNNIHDYGKKGKFINSDVQQFSSQNLDFQCHMSWFLYAICHGFSMLIHGYEVWEGCFFVDIGGMVDHHC